MEADDGRGRRENPNLWRRRGISPVAGQGRAGDFDAGGMQEVDGSRGGARAALRGQGKNPGGTPSMVWADGFDDRFINRIRARGDRLERWRNIAVWFT